ncbi:MAG: hypothetical protein HY204_09305 [Nitrospirae bacterium]|nr:hypothetical protein [Nitrospirota bacterium]
MASRLADVMNLITRTADGVFAIDSEDRIVLWNRSEEEHLFTRLQDPAAGPGPLPVEASSPRTDL